MVFLTEVEGGLYTKELLLLVEGRMGSLRWRGYTVLFGNLDLECDTQDRRAGGACQFWFTRVGLVMVIWEMRKKALGKTAR